MIATRTANFTLSTSMIPDWQLPPGVDRGLWDYLHATDMVAGYDEQMRASHLARQDVAFCEYVFRTPGKLLDLGCGTGRLCAHFAAKGFDCTGVDLSEEMLAKAKQNAPTSTFLKANLVELTELPEQSFDYAACLFSTLGMVRGAENRAKVLANAFRLLKPGGKFVLHVHNRYFRGLGRKRVWGQWLKTLFGSASAGEITMSQAYGGAPLTLHHFTYGGAARALRSTGFHIKGHQTIYDHSRPYACVIPSGGESNPPAPENPQDERPRGTYGYLFWAERPTES